MIFEQADYLKVGKPSPTCTRCGKTLEVEEKRLTVLIDRDSGPTPVETDAASVAGDSPPAEEPPRPDSAAATGKPVDASEGGPGPTKVEEPEEPAPDSGADSGSPDAPSPDAEDRSAEGPAKAGQKAEEDDAAFDRRDFCPQCWREMKDQAYFSFWVGHQRVENLPPKKMNRAERNVALSALFDSLEERNGAEQDFTPHLFFLAHLLMKYRVFKWEPAGSHPKTGEPVLRFSRSGAEADEDQTVYVPEVEMPDEMVLRIKQDVESYLHESTGQQIRL